MNFLNVFEQRVGNLFGATAQGVTAPFSFKKLAKKVAREMEKETFVVNGVDTAPSLYTILVSSDDDLIMRPLYSQLTTEVSQFVEGQAQGKGYVFVGKPVVRFMADPSLKSGRFSVFAEYVDAQTLNRLREEEARFLGADLASSNGLGGAAAEVLQNVPNTPDFAQGAQPIQAVTARETPAYGASDFLDEPFDAESLTVPPVMSRVPIQSIPTIDPAAAVANPMTAPAAAEVVPGASGLDVIPQEFDDAVPVQGVASQSVIPQGVTPQNIPAQGIANAAGVAGIAGVASYGTAQAANNLGAPQTVRVAQAVAAPAAAPITALLIDRTNGRTYTVQAPRTVIGRERNMGGIVLQDPNVSRAHCEITFDGRGWNLRDLNSTNGTLVNDRDINECALRDGDLITLGLTNLEFRGN